MKLLSSGYYHCKTGCPSRPGNKAAMNNELDNAYASFGGKFLVKVSMSQNILIYCPLFRDPI